MSRSILLLLFLIGITFSAGSQVNPKYLAGAVPEVNGKVEFSKTIVVQQTMTQSQIFDLVHQWAKENYPGNTATTNRILLADSDNKKIACGGEKEIIFKDAALALDRTFMTYQLIMEIGVQKCQVTIRNIKYNYASEPQIQPAENMISDKIALNKDKLNKYYDKFRTHTVDSINAIFTSINAQLNGSFPQNNNAQQAPPTVISVANIPASLESADINNSNALSAMLAGYKRIDADKIPGNVIKLLKDWTLITSGTEDDVNVMTASWGGLGTVWEKPVAFCFLNPTRYSVTTMDKGETYTISFYTEAYREALQYCGSTSGRNTDKIKGSGLTPIKTPSGATAFSEAWMILECKKVVAQQFTSESVTDKSLPDKWKKDGYHKMYIGEILNVWVK